MASSVPIRLADDHIEEARTCVRILNDPKTLEMLESAPEIVEDLEYHLKAHLTKALKSGIPIPPDLLGIIDMPAPGAPPGGPALPGAGAVPPGPGAAGAGAAGAPKLPPKPGAAAAAPPGAPPLIPPPTGVPNAATA